MSDTHGEIQCTMKQKSFQYCHENAATCSAGKKGMAVYLKLQRSSTPSLGWSYILWSAIILWITHMCIVHMQSFAM